VSKQAVALSLSFDLKALNLIALKSPKSHLNTNQSVSRKPELEPELKPELSQVVGPVPILDEGN
jgi:hypothetical protein